jgi:predicted O-methyltransferase YrrM
MDPARRVAAEAARGFMPPDEGLALHEAAVSLPRQPIGPLLEVGSYCGKSALYLGAAAAATGRVLFCVDHHRGSEENQPGWEWHEPDLVDPVAGRIDTLPWFRRTVFDAGLEDVVVAVVGESTQVARWWAAPLALLFIDGGHGRAIAHADYDAWSPHVAPGGRLVIHDVFPDPREGGRPPFEIYRRALDDDGFVEVADCGSLRVLERPAVPGAGAPPDPADRRQRPAKTS